MILMEKLNEEQEKIVLEEVGYNRQQLDKDVENIKEWLASQHHLPPCRMKEEDSFLKVFLTGCKGSLEKVKKKLDAYYTIRSNSEIFDCRDPLDPDYTSFKDIVYFTAMPKVIEEKLVRILIAKLADPDPEKFDFLNLARRLVNLADLDLRLETMAIRKFIIFDLKNCSANHLGKLRPLLIRDLIRIGQEILPFRYSEIYFVNAPTYVQTAFNNLISPFLSRKIKDKVHLYSYEFEELHKHVGRNNLPEDYDGTKPTLKELSDLWREKEVKERSWYINELSERTDETKRVHQKDTMNNPYFGVHGSLRQLVID